MATVNLKFAVGVLIAIGACGGGSPSDTADDTGGVGGAEGGHGGSDVQDEGGTGGGGTAGGAGGTTHDAGVGGSSGNAGSGGTSGAHDAMPPADTSQPPIEVPAGARRWTGKGSSIRFSVPENWSDNIAPGANDDVVLDEAPMKDCMIDQDFAIKSLTVTPKFLGTLNIASPGVIKGNMVLSGKVAIAFNPHIHFEVQGETVDLRNVTKLTTGFAKGSISMTGKTVQTFYPPTDTSIELCELQSFGGSTLKLGAPVKAIGLYVEADGAIDFNGQDVTVKIIGISGPVTGLGGIKLTVTGFANYTTNGLGFSYHSENKGITNLAPSKPWKLLVQQKTALYGSTPNTFTIKNAKIGNLDVTGSEPIKLMNCTNEGGNAGLTF